MMVMREMQIKFGFKMVVAWLEMKLGNGMEDESFLSIIYLICNDTKYLYLNINIIKELYYPNKVRLYIKLSEDESAISSRVKLHNSLFILASQRFNFNNFEIGIFRTGTLLHNRSLGKNMTL